MAYNTGNPIGSTDPRDAADNKENFDKFALSTEPTYIDRLGVERKSLQGMEDEFAAFIASSGYEFVGDYAVGIDLTGYQQILRDTSGEFWRLSGSATLPYTTTGAGLPEGGNFVAVGDAALRQALAMPVYGGNGAALVNGATIYIGSVAEGISGLIGVDGQAYQINGWHSGSEIGGGTFVYRASVAKSEHNGGTIISPTVPPVSQQTGADFLERRNNFLNGVGETDALGRGVFVKESQASMESAESFGAAPNSGIDEIRPIESCLNATGAVLLHSGEYLVSESIELLAGQVIKGQGIDATIIKAISPTGNNNFGGGSVIFSNAPEGAPYFGVKILDLTIDCNDLMSNNGTVGLKGNTLARCHGFLVSDVKVINCASYGFWCTDKTAGEGGYTFSKGLYQNCYAVDCNIAFEQVNTRGVTLNNCHASVSGRPLPYHVLSMFHPYGGEKMDLLYLNCTGEGPASTIFDPLLVCKHVRAFGCRFVNTNPGSAAMFMSGNDSDYDHISLSDCHIESVNGPGAQLGIGVNGDSTNTIRFSSCTFIGGNGAGAQINSNLGGGRFNFTDCETIGIRPSAGNVPFGLYENGSSADVKFVGGLCKAEGPSVGARPTNISSSSFIGTDLIPSPQSATSVRQRVVGAQTFSFDGSYGYVNVTFPSAIAGDHLIAENVTVEAMTTIHPRLADNAAMQNAARVLSFSMIDNQKVRIFANNSTGISVNYVITEWQ